MHESGSSQVSIDDLERLVVNVYLESKKHPEVCHCLICRGAAREKLAISFLIMNEFGE